MSLSSFGGIATFLLSLVTLPAGIVISLGACGSDESLQLPTMDADGGAREAASTLDANEASATDSQADGTPPPPLDAGEDAEPIDSSAGADGSDADASDAGASTSRVVLFGGTGGGESLGDTWLFDGATWTKFTGPGPEPRAENPVMATLGGKAVLFGGIVTANDGGPLIGPDGGHYHVIVENDTWAFDGTAWTHVAASPSPPARDSAVMARLDDKLVLFGGENLSVSPPYLLDTWTFDVGGFATGWTQRTTTKSPLDPVGAVMAPLNGALIVFGGQSHLPPGDTWSFDGADWTQLNVSGPSSRYGSVMAPLGGKLVLFGGFDLNASANLGETWTFDGSTWTKLAITGPSGRTGSAMAPLGGKLVLFGGFDGHVQDDTWTFDGSAWTRLNVAGPPGRWTAAMTAM